MHDPLKQGLKLEQIVGLANIKEVTVHDPLKQGLKLICSKKRSIHLKKVTVHDPLKQGLKLPEIA